MKEPFSIDFLIIHFYLLVFLYRETMFFYNHIVNNIIKIKLSLDDL